MHGLLRSQPHDDANAFATHVTRRTSEWPNPFS